MGKENEIRISKPFDGKEIDLCDPRVREYLDARSSLTQIQILQRYSGSLAEGQHVVLSWNCESDGPFEVQLFESDRSVHSFAVLPGEKTYCLGFLVPGREYSYRIVDLKSKTVSPLDSFYTKDSPVRYINLKGISNLRDLGGWRLEGGGRFRYGMLYRSGRLNSNGNEPNLSSEDLLLCQKELKIRTELDIRYASGDNGGQDKNCLDAEGFFYHFPLGQYSYIFPPFLKTGIVSRKFDSYSTVSLKNIFSVLSEPKNYPVIFHCNAGADRTGTLAFLIEALAGVEEADLIRDFELTSFSRYGNRWRSDPENLEAGILQDDKNNYVAFGELLSFMNTHYGKNRSLKEATESYLVEACGVTQEMIRSFQAVVAE